MPPQSRYPQNPRVDGYRFLASSLPDPVSPERRGGIPFYLVVDHLLSGKNMVEATSNLDAVLTEGTSFALYIKRSGIRRRRGCFSSDLVRTDGM